MTIIFGIASGIGNACFTLPAIKALRSLGHDIIGYVDTDFDMMALLARSPYFRQLVNAKTAPPPRADEYIAGHWCPPSLKRVPQLRHHRFVAEPDYPEPEWSLPMRAARDLGYTGVPKPDVSDWLGNRPQQQTWDVGFIPGCKPGIWERKRYPQMGNVATMLVRQGLRCAVFGQAGEARNEFDGRVDDQTGKYSLAELPDALTRCRVIVGTDSGPTHLASSLGVPVVALYSSTSPVKGQPVGLSAILLQSPTSLPCRPCQATIRWSACQDWKCQAIDPQAVVRSALELMEARHA